MEFYNLINEARPKLPKGLKSVKNIDMSTVMNSMVSGMIKVLRNKRLYKGDLSLRAFSKKLLREPGMTKVYLDVANTMSMKKFGKNFNELDDIAKQDIIRDVDGVWLQELDIQVKDMRSANSNDLYRPGLSRSDTKQLLKDKEHISKIENAIKEQVFGSSIHSVDDINRAIKDGSKVTQTEGKSIIKRFKNFFVGGQRTQVASSPGLLRRAVTSITLSLFTKGVVISLIKLGVPMSIILATYFGIKDSLPVVFSDEEGNEIDFDFDFDGATEGAKQKQVKSLEPFIMDGAAVHSDSSVIVKSPEYPDGLIYYNNGRVFNVKTGEKGSWSLNEVKNKISLLDLLTEGGDRRISLLNLLNEQEYQLDSKLNKDVDTVINLLDFPVSLSDMQSAMKILQPYITNGKGQKFLKRYEGSGLGSGTLKTSVNNVFTINGDSNDAKDILLNIVGKMEKSTPENTSTPSTSNTSTQQIKTPTVNPKIIWDNGKKTTGGNVSNSPSPTSSNSGSGEVTTQKRKIIKKSGMKFHDCNSKNFPYEYGCQNIIIKDMQECLGLKPDGKFGPATLKSLSDLGKSVKDKKLSYDVWFDITSNCSEYENNGGLTRIDSGNKKRDTSGEPISSSEKDSPNSFYLKLLNNGLIDRIFNETKTETYVRYTGPELLPSDLEKLDKSLRGMGWSRTNEISDDNATYIYKSN